MLSFSQPTGYALVALAYILRFKNRWVLGKDISEQANIPRLYLAKILNALAHAGIIRAKRGYKGGYELARPAEHISLLDIVKAVEGPRWKDQCLFGVSRPCPRERFCPLYQFWTVEKARIEAELLRLSIKDVVTLSSITYKKLARPSGSLPRPKCACRLFLEPNDEPSRPAANGKSAQR